MEETPAPPVAAPPPAAPRVGQWRNPWLVLALGALAVAGWAILDLRDQIGETRQEVARRLADADALGSEGRGALKQVQDQMAALQAKQGALDARLAEFQGQAASLQGLYQELARSRDDASLLEVEQAVTLAAQNLQLTGNVAAAVLALQTADARLARLDRPQFVPLRKAVGRDLDRLRSLPFVDVAGMSLKLENLLTAVDRLPLAMNARPPVAGKAEAPVTEGAASWERVVGGLWAEIKGLVRIQRFDREEPVLLAPGQSFFLRENLKLRLLNARLALLSRDQTTFRSELKAAQEGLTRHFEATDKAVQGAVTTLRQLAGADLVIELPNLNESLAALRGLKNGKAGK